MKQISKMMLAAVATVALVAPAFAWDFSASGSSSATYKRQTTNTGVSGASDVITNAYSSDGNGVTVSSSHSDGANSATFSYTAAWNSDAGNFDESVSVSGTKKVGNWTASSSTTQHMQKDIGPGADDNAAVSKPVASNPSAAITLTDGNITYKLGDASHLSTAEKAVNGPMSGTVDAEARVDSFEGFSVGLAVGPGTLTVAIDENSGTATDMFGDKSIAITCGGNAMGYGLNFAGDVGADLSFTYGAGSTTKEAACTGDNSSNSADMSTMGLGVAVPLGGMSLALDYESTAWNSKAANVETKNAVSGFEVSFTIPVGDATAGVNVSSQATVISVDGTDTSKTSVAGTEAWYTVPIGPVSLSVGYGSASTTTGCATCAAQQTTEITATDVQMGAEMSMSF